eukprot:Lithocolla_globosa_v1_NODE_639_length_3534_cov_8.197183.p2 type:complete len:175 gc:universal NODE_639_length_3534_cov_8.197183:339-863(+)
MPRGLVFCRTLDDTMDIYCFLKNYLGSLMFEDGKPQDYRSSYVDVFHALTEDEVKEVLGERFMTDSSLRVLVCTIAFGMGLDPTHGRWVVNYGIPPNPEAYIQETCRVGRDGNPADAILIEVLGSRQHGQLGMEDSMREYLDLESCRQTYLKKKFDHLHDLPCKICDNCKMEIP